MRLRAIVADGMIVAALMVVGGALAIQYLNAVPPKPYFFDWELVPSTMMACGRGFSQPASPFDGLTAFVARQTSAFDCSTLAAAAPSVSASQMALGSRYGLYGPVLAMRVGGTNWAVLDRYVAALFGLAVGLTYGLLRIVSMRPIAVLGTLLLALSTKLQEIMNHRDYIKEPPFLALLVVVTWMAARQRTPRQLLVASVVGGMLVGIGIGCRIDLLVIAPFFLFSIAALVKWPSGVRGWKNRGVAAALFLVSFTVVAFPIMRTMSGGSNLGHHVLLGFMAPFTNNLGLVAPAYDVGHAYSDTYAYHLIAAQARIREGDRGPLAGGTEPYDRAGARLDADIVRQFPADAVVRGYGAILQALDYPFSREGIFSSHALPGVSTAAPFKWIADRRFQFIEWFEGGGIWLTALALLLVATVDSRLAAFGAIASAYFCGYAMLQFQRRHTFHLDVFSVAAAMFLLQLAVSGTLRLAGVWDRTPLFSVRPARAMRNVAAFLLVAGVLAVAPLGVARWYQQRHVTTVIEETVRATNTPVPMSAAAINEHEVLVSNTSLGERIGPGPIDDSRDIRIEFLVAEFEGAACGSAAFPIRLQYTGAFRNMGNEFARTLSVSPPHGPEPFRLLSPAFYEYGPSWLHFDGLVLPEDRLGCLTALFRANRPGGLPFPFLYATFAPLWRHDALYQRFMWE